MYFGGQGNAYEMIGRVPHFGRVTTKAATSPGYYTLRTWGGSDGVAPTVQTGLPLEKQLTLSDIPARYGSRF